MATEKHWTRCCINQRHICTYGISVSCVMHPGSIINGIHDIKGVYDAILGDIEKKVHLEGRTTEHWSRTWNAPVKRHVLQHI